MLFSLGWGHLLSRLCDVVLLPRLDQLAVAIGSGAHPFGHGRCPAMTSLLCLDLKVVFLTRMVFISGLKGVDPEGRSSVAQRMPKLMELHHLFSFFINFSFFSAA